MHKKIKIRNGVPTKASIKTLCEKMPYPNQWSFIFSVNYGKPNTDFHVLLYHHYSMNEQLPEFIKLLNENGINVGDVDLYNSPKMGKIVIIKQCESIQL